jgi:hypothetical protein
MLTITNMAMVRNFEVISIPEKDNLGLADICTSGYFVFVFKSSGMKRRRRHRLEDIIHTHLHIYMHIYIRILNTYTEMGRIRTHIACIHTHRNLPWHIDPLLGNDRETNNETTAVARQRPARNNGSTVGNSIFYVVRSEAK